MLRLFLLSVLILAVAGACAPGPASTPQRTPLSVGLGYIPSVQFAQFYRAQQQGYYRDTGLEVTFQNQIDPNLITLIGQGAVDIGLADGTSVIPAAGQGIPVRYAATMYARFPNVVMAGADSGILTAADLAGHSVGIPGRYGSSWIMLQALLASAGLTPDDIEIRDYPEFGQGVALRLGEVDAATGFRNNEPVQLAREGFATNLLAIDEITPLPGPGLTVGESTLASKGESLRAFVAATLRAMDEIGANPELGLDAAIVVVPELAEQREAQRAILDATIAMWKSPYTAQHGQGAIDREAWATSLEFMRGLPGTNIPADLTADELVTEDLLP
ncbi:MAG: ABC transporter substrate-binding protein [Chloroflexota bacterium]